MKVRMLVEDRDSGFLFLDPDNAPDGAAEFDFSLDKGVLFADVEDDDKVVWLATNTTIRVVPRDSVDFANNPFDAEWPVPSCTICLTGQDYESLMTS